MTPGASIIALRGVMSGIILTTARCVHFFSRALGAPLFGSTHDESSGSSGAVFYGYEDIAPAPGATVMPISRGFG